MKGEVHVIESVPAHLDINNLNLNRVEDLTRVRALFCSGVEISAPKPDEP